MKNKIFVNAAIALIFGAIPLVAHYLTGRENPNHGVGFNLLIYEPFQFAYLIVSGLFFIIANTFLLIKYHGQLMISILTGFGLGVFISLSWYVVVFMILVQLHVFMGGVL